MTAAVLLVLIELAKSLPSNVRLWRAGSADGYSNMSLGILSGVGPAWVMLGVVTEAPGVTIACGIWMLLQLTLCVQVVAARPEGAGTLWGSAAVTSAAVGVVAFIGSRTHRTEDALGLIIVVSTLAYGAPGLFAGLRSSSTSGLSAVTLTLKMAEGIMYLMAGLGAGLLSPAGDVVLGFVGYGVVAVGCQAPVLLRVVKRRRLGLDGALTAPQLAVRVAESPLRVVP